MSSTGEHPTQSSRAERLAEIAERAGKATEGPWSYSEADTECREPRIYSDSQKKLVAATGNGENWIEAGDEWDANANFIAHARSDISWLLSELEAADSENAALIRDIESYVSISSEQAGIITCLRSALEEAKLALTEAAARLNDASSYAKHDGMKVAAADFAEDARRAAEVAAKLEKL